MNRRYASVIESMESRTLLSTYTVNTLTDAVKPVTGLLTLRQAIAAANAHAGADTVNFASSLFATAGQKTISLTQGQMNFTDTTGVTTVNGPGAGKLAINAHASNRVFSVTLKAGAALSGLTLTGGAAPVTVVSSGNSEGGGIYNAGSLSLTGITLSNCSAKGVTPDVMDPSLSQGQGLGGGIYSIGSLVVKSSTITGDTAVGIANLDSQTKAYGGAARGGGIFSDGPLSITGSSVSNDAAIAGGAGAYNGEISFGGYATGGGIYAVGTAAATISSSTISGDSATAGGSSGGDTDYGGNAVGGGVYCSVALTLTSTTVSTNTATGGAAPVGTFQFGVALSNGGGAFGAGVYSLQGTNVASCTFSGNVATGGVAGQQFYDGFGGPAVGGAINAGAALSITNSTFTKNSVVGGNLGGDDLDESAGAANGGAIAAGGSTTLQNSTVSNNTAIGGNILAWGIGGNAFGAGIYLQQSTVHVVDSTVANNSATGGNSGTAGGAGSINGGDAIGGIYAAGGTVRILNGTVAGNTAVGGAGSAVGSSTTAGNGGNAVGGVFSAQGLQAYDSTITANTATGGAGGAAGPGIAAGARGTAVGGISNPYGQGLLDNTIVSGNSADGAFSDIAGHVLTSSGYNLIGIGGGLTNGVNGNIVGVTSPKLSPLGNYGGPTQTLYPLPGSPAINAGSNALIPAGFTTDQRGLPRIVGGRVDIGSVEFSQIVITGAVYNDKNGDGIRQSSEPGLANWKVFIDLKNSGTYVVGDPVATTNSSGNYSLTFSPITVTGPLIIREVLQTGWARTQPRGAFPLGDYAISATVGTASNVNFGNKFG